MSAATNTDKEYQDKLALLKNWSNNINKAAKGDPEAPIILTEDMKVFRPGIPTGSPGLDAITHGGIPRGRFTEIVGEFSSGKSTLAYQIIGELHNRDSQALVVLMDAEGSFDEARGKRMGIDLDRLIIMNLRGAANKGLEYLRDVVKMPASASGKPAIDLIVVDSVAALVSPMELDSEIGDTTMAPLARLMNPALKMINAPLVGSGTAVILINQLRTNIGVRYGDPTTIPGGKGLDFYAMLLIKVSKQMSDTDTKKDKEGEVLEMVVKARLSKSRMGGAVGASALFKITPRDGIIFAYEATKLGVKVGIVTKAASFFTVKTLDGEIKEQGQDSFIRALKKLSREARNDLYDRLVKASMDQREALQDGETPEVESAEEAEEEAIDEVAGALAPEEKEE